jgi:hypothetical protein
VGRVWRGSAKRENIRKSENRRGKDGWRKNGVGLEGK